MNYKTSLKLVKEFGAIRYGLRQHAVLAYLVGRLYPGKGNDSKDVTFVEKTVTVGTLLQKAGSKPHGPCSSRHLRRLLGDLKDVVAVTEWKDKRITYRVDLTPLTQLDSATEQEAAQIARGEKMLRRRQRGKAAYAKRRDVNDPRLLNIIELAFFFNLIGRELLATTSHSPVVLSDSAQCAAA